MEENKKISISTILLFVSIIVIIALVSYICIEKLNSTNKINNSKVGISNFENSDLTSNEVNSDNMSSVISKENNINNDGILKSTSETNTVMSNLEQDKYSEIMNELSEDEIFFVTDADKNNDGTYTLKGVLYRVFTLTKSELENAVNNGGYKYYNPYGTEPSYVNYTVKKNYQEDMSDTIYEYAFIGKFKNEDRLEYCAVKKDNDTYYIENLTENNTEWKLTNDYRKITVSGDVEVLSGYDWEETSKVKNYFDNYKDKTVIDTGHPSGCFVLEFTNGKCSKIMERATGH